MAQRLLLSLALYFLDWSVALIELLRRMLDPAYLYALDPGPLGPWRAVYLAWAILLFLGCGAALWWQRRARHTAAAVTAWACGAGLALVGMRLLAPRLAGLRLASQLSAEARTLLLDVWTARVWPISATWVAVPAATRPNWLGPLGGAPTTSTMMSCAVMSPRSVQLSRIDPLKTS